jgi:hypothetical protein
VQLLHALLSRQSNWLVVAEPDAVCKNGVMKVVFKKVPETQPKKLNVRTE